MIRSIKHKGLRLLFEDGDRSKIRADLSAKAERFLDALHAASAPEDVDLPGYKLHRLTGNLQGAWSAMLSRNHRIIFRFEDGHAYDVDLVDYH
jgi:proteic killer suppression protein